MLKYMEDICFFEVNTKYISLSELKTSEFSRMRSTSEFVYVFNSRDEIYLVFAKKKQIFFFYFILYSKNQCISKLDKIGIFIDMKFH